MQYLLSVITHKCEKWSEMTCENDYSLTENSQKYKNCHFIHSFYFRLISTLELLSSAIENNIDSFMLPYFFPLNVGDHCSMNSFHGMTHLHLTTLQNNYFTNYKIAKSAPLSSLKGPTKNCGSRLQSSDGFSSVFLLQASVLTGKLPSPC